MHMTDKQMQIMLVICDGDGRDANGNLIPIDMDQLLERLPYKTTKMSMQFSIRALIANGIMYKGDYQHRRGRKRVTYFPTDLGRAMVKLGSSPSFIETEKDEALELLQPDRFASEGSIVSTDT
jgi:hypothetical protein